MRQHPFLMTRIGCLSIPVLPTVKEKDVGNAQVLKSAFAGQTSGLPVPGASGSWAAHRHAKRL